MAYHPMTPEEIRSFLTSVPPHTGKLATTRPDGRPHVAPIWFVLDDDGTIVFQTSSDTVKGRNLRRTGYAAMCVDNEQPPFDFVMVEGPVELIEDLPEVTHWAAVIGGRYMGADRAQEYGDRNGVVGEMVVRLHPAKMVSAADVAN